MHCQAREIVLYPDPLPCESSGFSNAEFHAFPAGVDSPDVYIDRGGRPNPPTGTTAFVQYLLTEEAAMNWDQIKGNWKQLKGKALEQWGDLTDDDMDRIAGRRDQLIGRIQERYGKTREEAEREVEEWEREL
jgi:uncharacterized protein YjbJ (UPF0337 family)